MALLSLGPASADPCMTPSICGIALASTARPSHWHFEGRRLAAPRVTDRPRLVGWSSLCHARRRRLTSLVVGAGTTLAGSMPAAQLVRAPHLAMREPGVDPRDQDRPAHAPSGAKRVEIGTPSVVSRADRVAPDVAVALVSFTESVTRPRAPFSPRGGPPLRASARRTERLRASTLPTTRLAAPRAPGHADASDRLLPSHVFVRAPAPRGFPGESARARARAFAGELPGSRQGVLASADRTFRFLVHRGGHCLPLAMCADAPLTSLSRVSGDPFALARLVSR